MRRSPTLTLVDDPQAWIFLSIGDAGGGSSWADLDSVIGMADSNNHAIPTVAELRVAVRLLSGAGLVELDGLRLRLTERGCNEYRRVNDAKLGHIKRFVNLAHAWGAVPPSQITPQLEWGLTENDWRVAYNTYHRRFQEMYKRLRESRGEPGGGPQARRL